MKNGEWRTRKFYQGARSRKDNKPLLWITIYINHETNQRIPNLQRNFTGSWAKHFVSQGQDLGVDIEGSCQDFVVENWEQFETYARKFDEKKK